MCTKVQCENKNELRYKTMFMTISDELRANWFQEQILGLFV